MDKKNIISLVLGLIIGGLAIWLVMSFTDLGSTMILRYGSQRPAQNVISTPTNTTKVGGVGMDEFLQEYVPWDADSCATRFDDHDYNVSGDLISFEPIEVFPPKFRLTWNVHLDIPLQCVKGGSTLNVKWFNLRATNEGDGGKKFPDDPVPRAWMRTDLFHEDAIDLPQDLELQTVRVTLEGFQQEMPGNKYGVSNQFFITRPGGQSIELGRFCAKPSLIKLGQGTYYFHWQESGQCTFY